MRRCTELVGSEGETGVNGELIESLAVQPTLNNAAIASNQYFMGRSILFGSSLFAASSTQPLDLLHRVRTGLASSCLRQGDRQSRAVRIVWWRPELRYDFNSLADFFEEKRAERAHPRLLPKPNGEPVVGEPERHHGDQGEQPHHQD